MRHMTNDINPAIFNLQDQDSLNKIRSRLIEVEEEIEYYTGMVDAAFFGQRRKELRDRLATAEKERRDLKAARIVYTKMRIGDL